jgi:serine/threonine-protein kinase
MRDARQERIEELFDELADADAQTRRRVLDAARIDKPGVAHEVEALLASHDVAVAFIETPAFEAAASLLEQADNAPVSGARIGRYRIIHEIGRGGMGEVFLAERDDDSFLQRVAVKVMKRGLDTEYLIKRFQNERQTLANLHHPNITHIIDGGATDDGRPFIVMEHVDGLPIDRYCDSQDLSIRDRITLFCKVCDAVHAAHMNLIVHRDLKPSNILVNESGEPKLLDFGVAKALNTEESDERTSLGSRMLTPGFASPEQLRGMRVTTASDVYSLGVILCVLLTGRRPFKDDGEQRHSATDEAARRESPTRPSEIASREAASADISGTRARYERLSRTLRGDLDTIVLKALRVDPDLRYASARALADDLRAHIAGEPIAARAPTLRYTIGKAITRRPLVAGLAGVTMIALIAAFTVSLVSLRQSEAARLSEARQRLVAEERAAEADEIVEFMRSVFASIDPLNARGKDTTVLRDALNDAAARLEGEAVDLAPAAESTLRRTIGVTLRAIGEYGPAERQLKEALALAQAAHGEAHLDTARAWQALAMLRLDQSRPEDAQTMLAAASRALESATPSAAGSDDSLIAERLSMLELQAVTLLELDRLPEAESLLRRIIEERNSAARTLPDSRADPAGLLAMAVARQGRLEDARILLEDHVSRLRETHGDSDVRTLSASNSLAIVLRRLDRYEEANEIYERCAEACAKVFGPEHRMTLTFRANAAIAKESLGANDDALAIYREVLAIQTAVLGEAHDDTLSTASSLAYLLSRIGETDEALAVYERALVVLNDDRPGPTLLRGVLLGGLGSSLCTAGRYEESERTIKEALRAIRDSVGTGHPAYRTTLAHLRTLYDADHMNDAAKLAALDSSAE